MVKLGNNLIAPKNKIVDALLSKLKHTASVSGNSAIIQDINRAFQKKQKKERKTEIRPHTILRSKLAHVDMRPNMDTDKNYFLNETLKLLAHADNYTKNKKFVALYNAGMVIAFLCVKVQHYALACKVYSLFAQILLVNRKT